MGFTVEMINSKKHQVSTLRVLHIIATVDRASGGPVEGLILSIKARKLIDQKIEILTLDAPESSCFQEFCVPVHGVGPGYGRYGFTPNLARWVIENAHRFDVAVIHGLWNHASIGGWQGCRKAGLPFVIYTHGMMNQWSRKTYPLKHLFKQIFWIVQGRVLRDAFEVLFTCAEEMKLAKGIYFGYTYSPRVVSYAADEASSYSLGDDLAFRSLVPDLGERPYLLYLGRIHVKKGCDLLIEGFAKAVKRPELNLVIAGPSEGDLIERLRAKASTLGIADRVHWPGLVKGSVKAGAFRGADSFVLTSHQENFGIAVVEALAYGCPVLISNQINIWREIEAGGGGLVRNDTVEGATLLIASWESMSPEARKKMRINARAVYENNFTVNAAVIALNEVLYRAIKKK